MFSADLGARPAADAAFIEDVFSTWLYTGNNSTQTVPNGIDLAGKGGLVWNKSRNQSDTAHWLWDTVRGGSACLTTSGDAFNFGGNGSNPSTNFWGLIPSSNGYSFGGSNPTGNALGATYASWTFRKQPKFFDVVTYTGNGAASRSIAHSLGSAPGCVMVKRTDATGNWKVAFTEGGALLVGPLCLNSAESESGTLSIQGGYINNANATTFTLVSNAGSVAEVNASGGTYVAYIFANDAGGFGATGADNVISCWYYAGNGSTAGPVVPLGYEPQWLLVKRVSGGTGDWNLIDNMRGFVVGGTDAELNPNLANAETTGTFVTPTATGFQLNTTDAGYNANGSLYVYIAIRRGPMRTPTSGTQVFSPVARTGTGAATTITSGFPTDFVASKNRTNAGFNVFDKLRGTSPYLVSITTGAEDLAPSNVISGWANTGINVGSDSGNYALNASGNPYITYQFGRAPGFFDVVCWTGDGSVNRAIAHNLSVPPELLICKSRTSLGSTFWRVLWTGSLTSSFNLNTNGANIPGNAPAFFGDGTSSGPATAPTATNFYVADEINRSGQSIVGYLFASCPGVSKVGSYTGTGATQVINCGFSSGARFVLIKRTDSTGDWYVWDSARGIVAGNDPYVIWNGPGGSAEVTNTDWVDTAASGFELSNAGGNAVNISGASYIFLSVA